MAKPTNDNKEFKFELAQYNQCYEHLLHHDKLIWQTPSYIITIGGTLLGASFVLVFHYKIPFIFGGILMFIAFFLSHSLTLALKKHRFFSWIEQNTLSKLELKYGRMIQRVTNPTKNTTIQTTEKPSLNDLYIYHKTPDKNLQYSAHEKLIWIAKILSRTFLFLAVMLTTYTIIDVLIAHKIIPSNYLSLFA